MKQREGREEERGAPQWGGILDQEDRCGEGQPKSGAEEEGADGDAREGFGGVREV